jgi:putative ABC transport system permease protein
MISPILQQSLPFLPLVLGLYISYSILKITDLSTDGSFILGAAVFGLALRANYSPITALSFSLITGLCLGCIVALLHIRLHPLLCGILLVFILSTAVLKMMGRPNLPLLEYPSYFSLLTTSCLFLVLLGAIAFFLSSKAGLMLQAFGNNPLLFHLCGKNGILYRMLGLSIHSMCATLSGALTAATSGYVDISMGIGVVLIALGTLILGQKIQLSFFSCSSHLIALTSATIAVLLYFFLLHILLRLGLDPIYLRLVIGLFLMSLLFTTSSKGAIA